MYRAFAPIRGRTSRGRIETPARVSFAERRSSFGSPLVEGVRTLLLVAGAVAKGDRCESVAFVKTSSPLVTLEGVEPNRRQQPAPGDFQQPGANTLSHPRGKQVELLDPAAVGRLRDSR